VSEVVARGHVDPQKLFVTAAAAGGVLTCWMIGRTDRFRAAATVYPVINWFSWVLTSDIPSFGVKYWFPGMPWEHTEHYMARSLFSVLGNVKTPTLVITGEEDWRTPISESEQYYTALRLAGVESVLVRVPQEPHGIRVRRATTWPRCSTSWAGSTATWSRAPMRRAVHRLPGLLIADHEFDVRSTRGPAGGAPERLRGASSWPRKNRRRTCPCCCSCRADRASPRRGRRRRRAGSSARLQDYRVLLAGPARHGAQHAGAPRHARRPAVRARARGVPRALPRRRDRRRLRMHPARAARRGHAVERAGQSYGGFCITHYLSARPEGLREVFVTGGLPPLGVAVDDVYRATYRRVAERNRLYYERYRRTSSSRVGSPTCSRQATSDCLAAAA